MKQIIPRKDALAGMDFTSEDHAMAPNVLRAAKNCHVQNGVATKRRGFQRLYKDSALRRGMLCQRASTERPFHVRNVNASLKHVVVHSYPSLSYGYLSWHADYAPLRSTAWAREFRLYTGKIDSGRNFYIFEQANDEDNGASVQWANICSTLSAYINTAGKLVVSFRASTAAATWTATRTYTSTATLTADTDYHIGFSYDGGSANGAGVLSVFINGVLDGTLAINWLANELWHGDPARHTSYPNLIWLNRLYVQREMASDTTDTGAGAVPDDYYREYPSSLECGAEGMGVYEIRFWSIAKNFAAVGYPLNRPLIAAEYGASCVGYWPCWDGGGLVAENLVHVRRPIQLLPAEPAYVADSGFSSGYGLSIAPSSMLFRYWTELDTQVDGVGAAFSKLFGDDDRSAQNPAVVGCTEYTINMRIRTPISPKRRPKNAGTAGAGAESDLNNLLSVYMASPLTPADMFGSRTFHLYIPWNLAGGTTDGSLYVNDNGAVTTAGTVLADDTVYSIWVTRSRTGAVSVYLDNSASTYSTATVTAFVDVATGIAITLGASFPGQSARGAKNFSGAFRMEWCRVWSRVLTLRERQVYYNQRLPDASRSDNTLLLNLEVSEPAGPELFSFCSYPTDFMLSQVYSSVRLGPVTAGGAAITRQWWDAWTNALPPYWGSHQVTTTYDPVGYEAAVESIGSHRSVFGGLSQLVFTANGILYADRDFVRTALPSSLVPARASSYRTFYKYTSQIASRQVGAADRLVVLSDYGYPHIWNGRALVPLGVDLPAVRRMPYALPAVPTIEPTSSVAGSLTADKWYSYKFVYVDEEFEVQGLVGPTVAEQTTATRALVVGSSLQDHADTANNSFRPLHCHLNPRVTGIRVYRSRGSESATLAEAGPFLYYATFTNVDTAFIDGTADDNLLPLQLDDSFDQPPAYRYADIFEGRLVLGHAAGARDAVQPSESGLPEHFNLSNRILTEDGTGGVVTGVRSAFDSCWVFKTGSIWRFVDSAQGLVGSLFTSSVGCIAPHSIVEFYNQALGRRMFFFWGPDGPYLFDGNQPVYIGQPLKGSPANAPFSQLKLDAITDIHAVDISKRGEIWLWAKDTNGEFTICYAYDYIRGAWTERTGLRFNAVGRVDVPRDITTAGSADSIRLATWMAGDQRGYIYELDKTDSDGTASISSDTTETLTGASTATVLTATAAHPNWVGTDPSLLPNLRGFPIWLIRATGAFEVRWILSNTNQTITVERTFASTPAAGSIITIGGIGFHLEYPWDSANADSIDKLFAYYILWHDGDVYARSAMDWAALTGGFSLVADTNKVRDRIYLNKLGEVLKLELTNYFAEQPVTIAARALEVSPTSSSVRAE